MPHHESTAMHAPRRVLRIFVLALIPGFFAANSARALPEAVQSSLSCGDMVGAPATPTSQSRPPERAVVGPLTRVADVPLPGEPSRFDYQSFDPTTGRLYIAHMGDGELIVFDTDASSVVGTIEDLPTVTGVLAVPELDRVYASVAGDHRVAVIDDQTLTVVARLSEIGFPDGLDYSPRTHRVFVSDESGGGELVVDTATDTVITTIDVGGEAGNTHYDAGSGCILVAVQSTNQLVAIDPTTEAVVGSMDLDSACDGPHGFAIDATTRLAFVSCEDSAQLDVVDLVSEHVTASFSVGDGPDVLAFDPRLNQLYVASESGIVSIFGEQQRALRPIGELSIPHAHSVAVDPATHLVYFPLQDIDGHPVLRIMAPLTSDLSG